LKGVFIGDSSLYVGSVVLGVTVFGVTVS